MNRHLSLQLYFLNVTLTGHSIFASEVSNTNSDNCC